MKTDVILNGLRSVLFTDLSTIVKSMSALEEIYHNNSFHYVLNQEANRRSLDVTFKDDTGKHHNYNVIWYSTES